MRILDAGHKYLLETLDSKDSLEEASITFVKREGNNFPFNVGAYPGTNCQEVLRVLIDRTQYLNSQNPCMESEAAIGLLYAALALYEIRAARRHGRHLSLDSTKHLVCDTVCQKCKHIGCDGNCGL